MIEKARTFGFEGSGIVPKEGSDTETTKVTFAVGDQEIEGLSLTAYAAFFTGVGEREERPLLPMLKRASAGKMSFKIDGLVDMTFDGAEISDMTLKPLRIGYGQLLTKLLSGEEPKLGPDGDPEDMRLFGIMMEDLPDMMQVKSFVYRTLNGKIEGDQPGTFRIGAIEGENLGSVSYGRLSFKDFVLDVPDAKGKLELFEVRDLDLGGVYKILGGLVRSRFVPNFTVIERNMPNLGQWVLKGLELDVPKEGGRIALANARFGMGRWIGVFPESISIGFDGLVIPAAAMKDTSPPSPSDLGYEQLNMAGGLDIKYDSDRSAYVVGPVFLSGQDMGTFTFNAQIGGISKVLMSVASVAGAVMSGGGQYLSAVTFDGAMVEVSNAEIIRRVLDWQAKAEGRSVKDLRESMKADLGTAIEAVTLGVPLPETDKKAIADAVAAFLDNPNSLRAVAEAKEKITLGDAINGNPESLGKLKLTVTANP
jgi:hypothetical protein